MRVLSWNTTSISDEIEIGRIYNNKSEHLNLSPSNSVDSTLPDGNQLAEINANEQASLFQNISVTSGEAYDWSLYHRGREGQEVMALIIGNQQENEPKKVNTSSDDQFITMSKWLFEDQNIYYNVPTKIMK